MARLIWKGSVRFGLVEIQVGLHPAERADELSFTFLDRKDLSPVGYERINKTTGQKVPWDRIVRGFKHASGDYVVITEDDVKNANVESTQSVDILAFVPAGDVDSMYYEKPYYLLPLTKKSKSYVLLREALRKSEKIGIAKVVIRTRQHLAAVSVRGPMIVLDLLRYPHELIAPEEVKVPKETLQAAIDPRELKMAERLIEGMSETWNPKQYKDDFRDDLLALIEKKVEAGQLRQSLKVEPKRVERKGKVVDLMPLLRQSLERAGSARTAPAAKRSAVAPKARAAAGTRHRPLVRKSRRAG